MAPKDRGAGRANLRCELFETGGEDNASDRADSAFDDGAGCGVRW